MVDYWTLDEDPYIDRKHKVLKNLAGITDPKQLEIYEDAVADASMLEISDFIRKRKIDFALWKEVHKVMFSDVYKWAGQIRTVRMSKGISIFANPQFIERSAKDLFSQLEQENFLQRAPLDKLAARLAFYYNELNAIHPFREGNGRSLKVVITEIARRAGFRILWDRLSFRENIAASIEGFNGNYQPFTDIFRRIMKPAQ